MNLSSIHPKPPLSGHPIQETPNEPIFPPNPNQIQPLTLSDPEPNPNPPAARWTLRRTAPPLFPLQ